MPASGDDTILTVNHRSHITHKTEVSSYNSEKGQGNMRELLDERSSRGGEMFLTRKLP